MQFSVKAMGQTHITVETERKDYPSWYFNLLVYSHTHVPVKPGDIQVFLLDY